MKFLFKRDWARASERERMKAEKGREEKKKKKKKKKDKKKMMKTNKNTRAKKTDQKEGF